MYKGKKILGLITARGGSKGLPGKNIRPLLGKPLVAWTVEQALASRYLDRVAISTDDRKIADAAKRFGVQETIMRPAKLATDTAKSIDVIRHAVEYLEKSGQAYDYLVLLEPTSPLRETEDIDRAIKMLLEDKSGAASIVSVSRAEAAHPDFLIRIGQGKRMVPYQKKAVNAKRRQDLSPLYFFEGTVYISRIPELLKQGTFYHDRTLAYVVPRWKSPEVDELCDLLSIEAVLKNRELIKQTTNHE